MQQRKFITYVLASLYENGVDDVDLTSLESKLYFYSKSDQYKHLFNDVIVDEEEKKVSIFKNFMPNISKFGKVKRHTKLSIPYFLINRKDIMDYRLYNDLDKNLIDDMACDIAILFGIEEKSDIPLTIVNKDVDCFVVDDMVVSGNNKTGLIQVITDGEERKFRDKNIFGTVYDNASFGLYTYLKSNGEYEMTLETNNMDERKLETLTFIGNNVLTDGSEYRVIQSSLSELYDKKEQLVNNSESKERVVKQMQKRKQINY